MSVALLWAQSRGGVIGAGGGIPWHVPEDQRRFRELTLGSTVLMGRRTWDSLPPRSRPLPGRRNLVLTRRRAWAADGAQPVASLEQALAADADLWVIGGGEVYALALPVADRAEVTEVDLEVDGDARAPALAAEAGWAVAARDPAAGWHTSRTGTRYRYLTVVRERGLGGEGMRGPAGRA